ncbi:MAG: GNAT family N-acetyltransferase [Burkholderiaceae bacterium]|nr:GNAT family N-acetyltransferase [Microbacteriaceae bacterium]
MVETPNPAFRFVRVDYVDPRAVALRAVMDEEMTERYHFPGDPPMSDTVARALAVDTAHIAATVLVIDGTGDAIAHAALRRHGGEWEVKRVIVRGAARGRGAGRSLMTELERIARSQGATRLILQCGDRQPEAVALYTGLGFTPIPVYEPYLSGIPNSLCFEKVLR